MKSRAPLIKVDLRRHSLAPDKPGETELAALFLRAWSLAPFAHHPDLLGNPRLTVDIHYVNDAEISELNLQHMNLHRPTDVLSFTMAEVDPERRAFNLGEVVVSYETAQRESAARKLPPTEELSRYCVHGFLHLLGYEDDTAAKRKAMFAVQEEALKSKLRVDGKIKTPRKQPRRKKK
jgi:probable rRNA maturation factor